MESLSLLNSNENSFFRNSFNRKFNSLSTKNILNTNNIKKNLFLQNFNLNCQEKKSKFLFDKTFLKLNNDLFDIKYKNKNNNSNLNLFSNNNITNNKRKNDILINLNDYQRVRSLSPSKEKNIQYNIKTISNELEKSPYYKKLFINPPISFTQKSKNNFIKNKLLFPINKNNSIINYIKKCSVTQQKKLSSNKKNNQLFNRNNSYNKRLFSDLKPFQLFKKDMK
jgi:hypothetical protein